MYVCQLVTGQMIFGAFIIKYELKQNNISIYNYNKNHNNGCHKQSLMTVSNCE